VDVASKRGSRAGGGIHYNIHDRPHLEEYPL
jgi:hypothetical protein